mgnify:CR=1 FL=1
MHRWHHWLMKNTLRIDGYLRSVSHRLPGFSEELLMSGVPLLEIVSEPDFRSAEEVLSYLTELRSILQYIGVSDCKMQEGSLRVDVNLSLRRPGGPLGTRTEMKNLGSFRAVKKAVAFEAKKPLEIVEVDVAMPKAGEVLLVLEAMKMQNEITADADGTVKAVNVEAGQNVKVKESLVILG